MTTRTLPQIAKLKSQRMYSVRHHQLLLWHIVTMPSATQVWQLSLFSCSLTVCGRASQCRARISSLNSSGLEGSLARLLRPANNPAIRLPLSLQMGALGCIVLSKQQLPHGILKSGPSRYLLLLHQGTILDLLCISGFADNCIWSPRNQVTVSICRHETINSDGLLQRHLDLDIAAPASAKATFRFCTRFAIPSIIIHVWLVAVLILPRMQLQGILCLLAGNVIIECANRQAPCSKGGGTLHEHPFRDHTDSNGMLQS